MMKRTVHALLSAAAVTGSLLVIPAVTDAPQATAAPSPGVSAALRDLGGLQVKGRAPKTGYTRTQFGTAWSDDVTVAGGHNGCDTRNDILRRDLRSVTTKPGTRNCVVTSGTLQDPYTRATIHFVRGPQSAQVQIDHIVALSDAWQKGAQRWTAAKRRNFANDPRNLLAVSGTANQQKRDGDAATWLPANKSYRCTYVAKQVRVKKAYGLWVTAAEGAAIRRILTSCNTTPGPTTTPQDRTPPSGVYYENCAAVRAAGAAPIYRGQPGYRSALDRDGDGVGCETTTATPRTVTPQPVTPSSAYYPNCSAARAAGAAPVYRGQPGYRPALDRDGDGVGCES